MVHDHSKTIYHRIMNDGSKDARFKKVFEIIYFSKVPLTDYQVLQKFRLGSDNLNLVQPRLSEGHKKDKKGNPPIYQEGPPGKSVYKDSPVRTTMIALSDVENGQLELSL